jgi:hypothetical protein
MANELQIQVGVNYTKNAATFQRSPSTSAVTVSGNHVVCGTQAVGFAAAEALGKGDITTCGYLFIHNLDATNFVQVGYDDSGFKPLVKLLKGEWSLFRLAQNTPQVQADTGACNIEYWLFEA